MTYLALFEDATRRVDREVLIAALERDWPAARIPVDQPSQESRDVVWTYSDRGEELEGYSHVDGTCIYMDSSLRLAAKFAVWYRGLVSPDLDVIFCDDGYNFSGNIEPGMSEDDVMAICR